MAAINASYPAVFARFNDQGEHVSSHPVLTPATVGGLSLPNRAAVAPMSRVSTGGDGVPTAEMAGYYARFATGGFGLIISEGAYTDEKHSQAYPN